LLINCRTWLDVISSSVTADDPDELDQAIDSIDLAEEAVTDATVDAYFKRLEERS
jgi:hypothetical protein